MDSNNFIERTKPGTSRGIPIIRLRARSKLPLDNAWQQKATTDPETIAAWGEDTPNANVGYVAQGRIGGVWILDLDSNSLAQDYEQATGKTLTATFTVASKKGQHRYYAHNESSISMGNIGQQANEEDLGFSVRAHNQYCVSPLSIHPDSGLPYLIDSDVEIVEADAELVQFLVAKKKQKSEKKSAKKPTDTGAATHTGAVTIDSARVSQLVTSDDFIPYGMHDVTLTAIAGKLRGIGMEENGIYAAILEACEKRAQDAGPDAPEMCRKIAHSVCRYKPGTSLNLLKLGGNYVDPAIYDALLLRLDEEKPSWIMEHVPKASQLSTEPLTWIVEEVILEHGLHLFSGKPGSMKSLTALLLAKSILTNTEFMGRKAAGRPVTVVYIDRENPQAEVRKRCAALGLLDLENFRVWGDWSPDSPPPLSLDDPRLFECAGRDSALFVFDSLSSYLCGANENDSGEMMEIMSRGRKLARASAGVIILHHQSRQGIGSRGSTSIAASTDMAFVMEKQANDVVLTEERFRCCRGYTLRWTMDFGPFGIGPYTSRLVGSIAPSCRDAAKHSGGNDDDLIRRAAVIIEEEHVLGRPINQTTLAKLLGISSNSKKQNILNGASSRPWICSVGPRGCILFNPKPKHTGRPAERGPCPPQFESMTVPF
jgi:Bifunctional DNA primase/polymerase, N-terminal/AAA domain